MDKNSKAMLKKAVDMEHENLPEFKKYETRLKLGEHLRADENHLDSGNNDIDSGVATARENEQNEHEKYVESDDEQLRDQVHEQDAPEHAPELPNAPPPIVHCTADMPLEYNTNNLVTDGHKENKTEELKEQNKNSMKSSFQNDPTFGNEQVEDENDMCVVSIKMENNKVKVEIGQAGVDDTVGPVNIERQHEFPSHLAMVKLQADARNDSENEKLNAIKTKSPSHVLLKSNTVLINLDGSVRKTKHFSQPEYIAEEIIAPVMFSSAINYSANRHVEISPPKHEQEVVSREMLSVSKNMEREMSPSRNEVIEIEKAVIKKPKDSIPAGPQIVIETFPNLQAQLGQVPHTLPTNTSIIVGEAEKNIVKIDSDTNEQIVNESVSHAVVLPVSLETITDADIDIMFSQEEYSKGILSPPTYKTTIDETKHGDIEKPQSALTMPVKSLSPIKPLSFSHKSLPQSSPRPMQYTSMASTIGTNFLLPSISKSDAGSQKADYPVKRMESMPFEVSVLKGILGIGIKTSMTPGGYVQVTEILPNGPVGREGNTKVGDYILSINGTELTGQTDGKVQQILRLLPRGLSKIVVSPVPPETSPDKVPVVGDIEKAHLKTHQPLSLTSPLAPKQSFVLSQRLPTASTTSHMTESAITLQYKDRPSSIKDIQSSKNTSTSPLQSPQSPDPASTRSSLSSPRSPKLLSDSSVPSSMSHFGLEMAQIPKEEHSFNLDTITSKLSSPRQPGSQQNVPRMPPPVAPKPTKVNKKIAESKTGDHNTPIETEIFVPISVTNDTLSSTGNTNWTPGIVSLADIKTADAKWQKNVVYAHEQPNEVHTIDIEDSSKIILSDTEDNNSKSMTVDYDTLCLEAIESVNKLDVVHSQTDNSFSENKHDTLSTSSSSDNGCNIEDIIPEHIEEETELKRMDNLESDLLGTNADIVMARSKDVEGESNTTVQSTNNLDMDSLQDIAETIVAHVIESVQEMDLSSHEPGDILPSLPEEIPQLPTEASPIPINCPPNLDDIAFCCDEGPPPLPSSEEPTFNPVPANVVDLALYPDTDQNEVDSHEQLNKSKHGENEVIDVVTKSVDVTLHAMSPFTDTNVSKSDIYRGEFSLPHVTEKSAGRGDNENIDDSKVGDQSISNVISLYSNIENSLESDNLDRNHFSLRNNIDELKGSNDDATNILSHVDESENCGTKSLSNSEDFESDPDIAEKVVIDSGITVKVASVSGITVKVANDSDIIEKVVSDSDIAKTVVSDPDIAEEVARDPGIAEKVSSDSDIAKNIVSDHKIAEKVSSDSDIAKNIVSDHKIAEKVANDSDIAKNVISDLDIAENVVVGNNRSGEFSEIKSGLVLTVTMNKGVTGLGFVIQGGKFSPIGDQPISIKRIFKGGPAEGLLQEMDEIMEVNDQDISNMRQNEAWNHLKYLPSGNVMIKIRRHSTQKPDV